MNKSSLNASSTNLSLCLTAVGLMLLALAAAGCGPLYGIFIDPLIPAPKVAAEHDMSREKILVWVDISPAAGRNPLLRRETTLALHQELTDHKAVGDLVDYDRIIRYRHDHLLLADKSIQQLGSDLDARQVLYVLIDKYQLRHEAGEGYFHASASGYAKVIDAENGDRLWPPGQTHRPFVFDGQVEIGKGQAFESEQMQLLCQSIAHRIAPFFYEHRIPKR